MPVHACMSRDVPLLGLPVPFHTAILVEFLADIRIKALLIGAIVKLILRSGFMSFGLCYT